MKFSTVRERMAGKPWPTLVLVDRFVGLVWLGWYVGAGWLEEDSE